jgi:hypothetical protein
MRLLLARSSRLYPCGQGSSPLFVQEHPHRTALCISCCFLRLITQSSYPADENILGKLAIRILDLDEGELDATVVKVLNKIDELTLFEDALVSHFDGSRVCSLTSCTLHFQHTVLV